MDGKLYPEPRLRQNHAKKVQGTQLGGVQDGASDPIARLDDLDTDGIDVQVMYGSLGLAISTIADADFAVAMARACNGYYASFCSAGPGPPQVHRHAAGAGHAGGGRGGEAGGHRARPRRPDAGAHLRRPRPRRPRYFHPLFALAAGARRADLDALGQRVAPAGGRQRALRHPLHGARRRAPVRADDRPRQHRVRGRARGLPASCASASSRPGAAGRRTGSNGSTSTSSGGRARCRR